jgi:hypothetical protein
MESVEDINKRLKENYGRFSTTDMPLYRVVWSDDQLEKRWTWLTKEGLELNYPEVREYQKYKQWAAHVYFLERLLVRPPTGNEEGMPVEEVGYEPVWCFMDHNQNPLPPIYEVCEIVIESILTAAAKAIGMTRNPKYRDPYAGMNTDDVKEVNRNRIAKLEKDLFGNETPAGTAIAHGWGVSLNTSETNKKELSK